MSIGGSAIGISTKGAQSRLPVAQNSALRSTTAILPLQSKLENFSALINSINDVIGMGSNSSQNIIETSLKAYSAGVGDINQV